jgi:hypothetical protein
MSSIILPIGSSRHVDSTPQGIAGYRCGRRRRAQRARAAGVGAQARGAAQSTTPTPRAGIAGSGARGNLSRHPWPARRITVADILRAAGTVEEAEEAGGEDSRILNEVVLPAVADAERAFTLALAQLNLEELVRRAEPLRDRNA